MTSLVISFALQDTLSGLASGMLLLSDPPFQPGDWINSGDLEGKVLDVNWRTTRIQNRDGDTIVVPNSQLAGASIVNYASAAGIHKVRVDLQVAYLNPPTLAKAMLLDAARGTPGVLDEPAPYVAVTQIDDPLMGYQVHMWIEDYAIEPRVKTDFGSLVWYQSHRHGVPLPSPAQDLYLYDGVAAGEASVPTPAELRRLLSKSQLLVSLGDDDLDRLARVSRLERFSVGEVMVDSRTAGQDLLLIAEGRAELALIEANGTETTVAELGPGETVGLLGDAPGDGSRLISRALDDCVVIIVDAATSAEVGSRNVDVAAAFNRLVTLRRRRVERMFERRQSDRSAALDESVAVMTAAAPDSYRGAHGAEVVDRRTRRRRPPSGPVPARCRGGVVRVSSDVSSPGPSWRRRWRRCCSSAGSTSSPPTGCSTTAPRISSRRSGRRGRGPSRPASNGCSAKCRPCRETSVSSERSKISPTVSPTSTERRSPTSRRRHSRRSTSRSSSNASSSSGSTRSPSTTSFPRATPVGTSSTTTWPCRPGADVEPGSVDDAGDGSSVQRCARSPSRKPRQDAHPGTRRR